MRVGLSVPSCCYVIGSIFNRRFASRIPQNQNVFGNFASVKNERAIFVNDCHLRSTRPFLSRWCGGAAQIRVPWVRSNAPAFPLINRGSKSHWIVSGKPPASIQISIMLRIYRHLKSLAYHIQRSLLYIDRQEQEHTCFHHMMHHHHIQYPYQRPLMGL